MRCRLKALPSNSAASWLRPFTKAAVASRRSFVLKLPVCPHIFGALKLTALATGKNNGTPSGTEHVRFAVPPKKAPAKNQTESRCPTMQLSPLLSSIGFTEVGIDNAHCHH